MLLFGFSFVFPLYSLSSSSPLPLPDHHLPFPRLLSIPHHHLNSYTSDLSLYPHPHHPIHSSFSLTLTPSPFTLQPSFSEHARIVVHDVPVLPLPRRQWHLYQEPEMPHFTASIYLPPLKKLRHVVERMKTLSPSLTLSANRKGTLVLSVTSSTASVSTYFRNLNTPTWGEAGGCY